MIDTLLGHIVPMVITLTSNASYPIINIPATLTPILGPAAPAQAAAATSSTLIDATTISGAVALATSAYAAIKDHLGNKKQDNRAGATITNQEKIVTSLKNTDLGVRDDIVGLNALVKKLCENPELAKVLTEPTDESHGLGGKSVADYIKEQTEEWEKSNKEYYENTTADVNDVSNDPIIRKAAEISKQTSPTLT